MNEDKKQLNTPRQSGASWVPAMQIFSEISTWIVVPIVLALVGGKALDAHFGTEPIIFFCLAGLGFLITCFGMVRVVKNYMKKFPPEADQPKAEKDSK